MNRADPSFTHTSKNNSIQPFPACCGDESQPYRTLSETITAAPEQTLRYLNRLSGPFLDRFDLHWDPITTPGILSKTIVPGESSATVNNV